MVIETSGRTSGKIVLLWILFHQHSKISPKKRVQEVPQNKAAAAIQNVAVQPSSKLTPIPKPVVPSSVESPPDFTVVDLSPSAENHLKTDSPTINVGNGETNSKVTGKETDGRNSGSGTSLGNMAQSDRIGEDAFGGGVFRYRRQ